MASISSILSILVKAETNDAQAKLHQFDARMAKTRAEAAKGIKAQLGANFDRRAFDEYEKYLDKAQRRVRDKAAFKAALGADFDSRAFTAYQRSLDKADSDTRRTANSLGVLEKRFTGAKSKVSDFNQGMLGLKNVVGLIKWPAYIAGAGLATQAVGALAAGAIGLGSALAPLSGLGAAAAAGYVAFGQGLGVAKLAFGGLTKALNGNKVALAALTPAQRVLLKDLQNVKAQVRSLQNTAAAGMTPGLEKGLRSVTPLFKVFRPIVAATAKEMGNLAAVAGRTVGGWGKDLATVGKTNVGVIHNLGMAAISLGTAFKDIVVVAGPLLTWMSELVRVGAGWVQQQVAAGRESGRLTLFLGKTEEVMRTLISIAINLGASFFNIGKAAAPLGRDLLASLERLTQKMREWTGSAQGQQKLATYFNNMKAPLYAIFGLVGDIGKALIRLSGAPGLTHVVDKLRQLVPVLQAVIGSTTQGFSSVFIDALTNVVKLFGDLAGTSGPLTLFVKAIGWVAGALHSLAQSSPGVHSAVVDLVGLGAVVKVLSFIPKLPIVGSLIGLFTATKGARSLGDLLKVGGAGGGLGGLFSKVSKVSTMEVGVLVVKSMPGGGGVPGGGGIRTAEREAGGATAATIARDALIRFMPEAIATIAVLKTMNLLPRLGGPQRPTVRPTASNPQGIPQAGFTFDTLGRRFPTQRTASNPQGIRLGQSGGINYLPGGDPQAAAMSHRHMTQAAQDLAAVSTQLEKLAQHQASAKQTADALDKLAQKAHKVGDVKWEMADKLGAELLRTHSVASQGVQRLLGQLNRLPPGAAAAASQSMVQMSQMLETQGQLPRGSTTRLVLDMLSKYRGMRDQGGTYFRGLLTAATTNLHALQVTANTTTGKAHDQALANIKKLQGGVGAALGGMESDTVKKMNAISGKIKGGSADAAKKGSGMFWGFAGQVSQAEQAGLVSAQQGTALIDQALNAALKAFGAKSVSLPKIAGAVKKVAQPALNFFSSGFATGGMVNAPGYFAGEEAPQHPEVIIASNPAYRQRNLKLWATAGSMLGVPGFQQGGVFGGLETLWTGAGGPASLAPLMAAIAMAESGGNPLAHNPSGASGLWQILGQIVGGNVYNPHINALNAVAKWRTQGLGAWEAYTNGSYRRFLGGANAGALGVPSFAGIDTPHVAGSGAVTQIVQAMLGKATTAANAYVMRHMPSVIGGPLGGGSAGGPTGVGTFQGLQVANWVIAALRYAQGKGVNFRITSGYRPGFDPHAPSGSEHAGTQYPHGAVDFGGMVDPASFPVKMAVVNATRSFRWPLLAPIGFRDDGHASGTGHYRGGIHGAIPFAGAFGQGGMLSVNRPTLAMIGDRGPETAMFMPGFKKGGIPGAIGALIAAAPKVLARKAAPKPPPSWRSLTGMPAVPRLHGHAPTTTAGAAHIASQIGGLRGQISGWEHEYSILGSFFGINPPTLIDPVTGAVNHSALAQQLSQLDRLVALRQQIFNAWQRVMALTKRLIVSYRAIIAHTRRALAKIVTKGLKGKSLTAAQKQQTADQTLIAKVQGQLSSANGDLTSASDDRDAAWISLLTDKASRAATAATQPTAVAAPAVAATTDQAALLQTLLTQSQQTLAVSQAQYSVLANYPPYLGGAAAGGLVTVGERGPELVSLPVGARVFPNQGGTSQPVVQVIIEDGAVDPNKIRVIAEGAAVQVTRRESRAGMVGVRLPGGV